MRLLPVLLLVTACVGKAADPAILEVRDIRPGMKGHGLTVFQGSKIERFTFEVLGVQRNSTPGRSIIWVRAAGGPLAESGILKGMSGSPCYIDGKLIGAMAMATVGEKDAVGGITPIQEMLEQLRDVPDAVAARTPLILPKLEPPKVLKSCLRGEMIPMVELMGNRSKQGDAVPLPLPVFGTALTPEAQSFWQNTGFHFTGGATLSSVMGMEASPLEPGGMIGVGLVQGDLEIFGTGTITYVSGKRILALGHSMYGLGPVDLPLWSAYVAASVPGYSESYKLSMPVAQVGSVKLDRASGIAGVLGTEPKMVPLRVGLNLGGKRNFNFKFELMDNPLVTPNLAATVVTQCLAANIRGTGFQSLSLQGNIKITGHTPIQMEFMSADAQSTRLGNYVGSLLQAVTLNAFERPVIEGISITIKAEERLDLTQIVGVRLLKGRARRGEILPVVVTLQDMQGGRETTTLNLQVPNSARPGPALLMVGDGLSLANADTDERSVDVGNMGDVVRILNGAMKNNHAYALLVQQQAGAGLRGTRIDAIPPAVSSLLGADADAKDNRLQRRILGRAVLPLEREVRGLNLVDVEVE